MELYYFIAYWLMVTKQLDFVTDFESRFFIFYNGPGNVNKEPFFQNFPSIYDVAKSPFSILELLEWAVLILWCNSRVNRCCNRLMPERKVSQRRIMQRVTNSFLVTCRYNLSLSKRFESGDSNCTRKRLEGHAVKKVSSHYCLFTSMNDTPTIALNITSLGKTFWWTPNWFCNEARRKLFYL